MVFIFEVWDDHFKPLEVSSWIPQVFSRFMMYEQFEMQTKCSPRNDSLFCTRRWGSETLTSATAHPVCSSLSGPCRPGSKQGKVSVMYCIQEFLSDHADVLVVLVDVGSRTL